MKYTVSEDLKIIMDRKGVTITSLAEQLGQTRQNLSMKFKNNNFNLKDLDKISERLNVDYDVTFKEKE